MAEFKLGRIRFVWKSTWVTGTTYFKDDVVEYGGKIYICVTGHVGSAAFFTDLDITPSKWNIMADGQKWLGDWAPQTAYIRENIVRYGATVYICKTDHTSAVDSSTGLEPDIAKWDVFATGLEYQGDWATTYDYKANDLVKYGGSTYVCNTYHISAATTALGLEADLSKWTAFNQGFDWKTDWAPSVRYKLNDVVKFGASLWIVNTYHTSQATFAADSAKWTKFVEGFQYENEWNDAIGYQPGDVVQFGGNSYIAKEDTLGPKPGDSGGVITAASNASEIVITSNLHELSNGKQINITGVVGMTQLNTNNYYVGAVSTNTFKLYTDRALTAVVDSTGFSAYTSGGTWITTATGTPEWELFARGMKFQGDWEEDSTNRYYLQGDTVRLGGYMYRCVLSHRTQTPPNTTYWEKLSTGFDWKGTWIDDATYVLGDVVRYGDSSYVCIQGHISEGDDGSSTDPDGTGGVSADNSRPDQDTTGTYWNVMTIGTEQSVLTTKGDMVYYSGATPVRLPVGQDGQILTVNSSGVPNWEFLGQSVDVYYVAEHGTNSPAPIYGKNIDRPFKSIRYAAQQVERGTKAVDAARLLEMNRRFIQREIVEWTDYQIANNTAPFVTAFKYDSKKCERDMGYIIDAFLYDVRHGGNVKSREVALSYVTDPGQFYALGQEAETVASITYGISLIEKVLQQAAPAVNYQTTNGDNSTRVVPQYFETALGAQDTVVYDGVISGSSSGGTYSDETPEGGYAEGGGY
jgi:hypothetical protein